MTSAASSSPDPGEDRLLAGRLLASRLLDPKELAAELTRQVGRYRVLRVLGRGASSEVLLAEDPSLGRQVAIKLLTSTVAIAPARFQREMRVLAALEHPSIVRILDAGVLEDGRPFFVMDYAGDRTLEAARPPLRRWVEVLAEVARACHFAHGQGVIHRDLKPSNILLGARPIVADFGVAKLLGVDGAQLTRAGALVGTPQYMAPEQVGATGEVGPATDVYALGALLYQGLTGRPPFDGDRLLEVMARIASEPPARPGEVAPDVPAALEAIALRALAKRPGERHESAAAFADALEAWLRRGDGGRATTWLGVAVVAAVALVAAALAARSGLADPPLAVAVTEARAPAVGAADVRSQRPGAPPGATDPAPPAAPASPLAAARARLVAACSDPVLSASLVDAAARALRLDPDAADAARLLARWVRAVGVAALTGEATIRSRREPALEPSVRDLRAALKRAAEARPGEGALALGCACAVELDYWFTTQRLEDRNAAEGHLEAALALDPRSIDVALHCALHALVRARSIREGMATGRSARDSRIAAQLAETRRTCLSDCEAHLARARGLEPDHPELAPLAALLQAERAR